MRNLKKFLALVLSMMMVLSLVVTASASGSITTDGTEQKLNDTASSPFQTAIDVLNGMDVMKGDANPGSSEPNGNFRPTDSITRAEVAALVFRLTTGRTEAGAADHYARYGNFSDVREDAWYAGYVGYCANAGYIKGYAGMEGPFGPTDKVTGYQALAMILRAMGYGVNGEFEGGNWMLAVSATATQNGVLDHITNANYGEATLREPAQRQVVAQIFFDAINTPCVVYTPAFGYQTTSVQSGINAGVTDAGDTAKRTLGERYFGLTSSSRVIVANQATGETVTKTGDNYWGDKQYAYSLPGSVFRNDEGEITGRVTGLNLNLETGIDLFGHLITVYYDGFNVKSGSSARRVYAYYDEAKDTVVYAKDGDMKDALGTAINNAKGFSVDTWNGAFVSDRFDVIDVTPLNFDAKKFAAPDLDYYNATTTKVKEDTGALPYGAPDVTDASTNGNQETGGFFKIVSNDGSHANLVISLAPELARITEQNTISSNTLLRLSGKSDIELANESYSYPSTFGEDDDGVIRKNSLTKSSNGQLGDLVLAQEIKGTNYDINASRELTKVDPNMYYYQVDKVAQTKVGTVKTYDPTTGKVTLTDNTELAFTRLPIINEAVKPAVDEVHGESNLYFYNGVQYEFLLDPMEPNRYVDYTQADGYEFLYGVYADSDIGGLGSADLTYAITGVDWDGNVKYVQPFTSINKVPVTGTTYEQLTITKKNLGGASNTVGNEIFSGLYTGYGYNAATKDLDAAVAGIDTENWIGMPSASEDNHYANNYWDGKLVSTFNGTDDGSGVWEITKGDVADGWSEQTTAFTHGSIPESQVGRLLLTPQTKFYVVSGLGVAGSSNPVKVDILNGIEGLLAGANKATIDVKRLLWDADGNITAQNPDYNVYFQVDDVLYNNYYKDSWGVEYSDDNYVVTKVILPAAALKRSSSNNLWFTNKAAATGNYLADTHADTQSIAEYRVWLNGEPQTVFVDWRKSTNDNGATMSSVNDFVDSTKIGMFFELTPIDTINGVTIYKADAMNTNYVVDNVYASNNPNSICNVGLKYDYTAVNDVHTARLTQRDATYITSTGYTGADVYNVSNARVVDLTGTGLSGENVANLNRAVSIGYDVTVAIVNNGTHSVSLIYVTDVDNIGVTTK